MKWWGLIFQNPVTESMHYLDWFHDYICMFLVLVLVFVSGVLWYLSFMKWLVIGSSEHAYLEFIWTTIPALILIMVGIPSMYVLYSHSIEAKNDLSVKVTGHQWYWSYDYMDFPSVNFDSFMTPLTNLSCGDFRLLETDNHIVFPLLSQIRLAISSADVLHAWTIPPMGAKIDAVPGRTNFLFISGLFPGLFFGQCSEICGANHSFMPISLEFVSFNMFKIWLKSFWA